MIKRICNLSKNNSFFLFGPRGSGKTSYLKHRYKDALYIDLLDIETFDELLLNPARFKDHINSAENKGKRVIVDEIQKLPRLLDTVQVEIQKNKRQFILTGSSARRLKQKGNNLLAGRAWVYNLYPFSTLELDDQFDLKKSLERGALPDAYLADNFMDCKEYLNAYVATYLQKEIQEEQWVRKLSPFRKFLAISAQMNGKIINKSKIAREVGVDDVTVANYFEILEDTLIGFMLPSFHRSLRKAQKKAPKFYFIDPGIKRALDKTLVVELLPQTSAFGEAFEHWVILEFIKNSSYNRLDWDFSYICTKDDVEIDLIIDRPGEKRLLIEIKSKNTVSESDIKNLETLGTDLDAEAEKWILSNDPLDRMIKNTHAMHWKEALKHFFSNKASDLLS